MNEITKESKFLDAINKYAEKQKATISTEVEEYKNQRIEQATEQGLKDAYELIQRDIARQKAQIITETSTKESALRTKQFKLRQRICDDVFQNARQKLIAFTETDAYKDMLRKSATKIKELFGDEAITVYVSEKDVLRAETISAVLPNAQIKTDQTIVIGGLKAYGKSQGVLADDTLDTKLSEQRDWFIENSGLKVV